MAHSKFFLTSALTLFLCCMPCTLFAEDISQQELTGEESAGEKDISHAVSAGLYAFTGIHGFEPYSQAVAAVYQFNMPVLTANAAARFAAAHIINLFLLLLPLSLQPLLLP